VELTTKGEYVYQLTSKKHIDVALPLTVMEQAMPAVDTL